MDRIFDLFRISILMLCLTSCGYQVGPSSDLNFYSSISIPYVEGDPDGNLTNAIAHAISANTCLEYRRDDGALQLKAAIVNSNDVNIGFRYDRHKDGTILHSLIPVESRLSIVVEFSVVEAASNKVVLGPVQLSAYVDLDHDYYADRNPVDGRVNQTSLGQLTYEGEAFKAAERPLNRAIALKIANYLSHSW
jgi:hypothetical protein